MSSTRKIIVVTNSFLFSSGIESLALELSGLLVEHVFSGSEKRLSQKIIDSKPEFVIIDPEAISDCLIPTLRELQNDRDIVTIGLINPNSSEKIISRFSNTLTTNGNKFQLTEQLQNIVGSESAKPTSEQLISKRETEILKYLVMGFTNQEVADKLFLSIHTVMTHRKKINRKLGIKTVSGLTVYALMNNIVDIREVERSI